MKKLVTTNPKQIKPLPVYHNRVYDKILVGTSRVRNNNKPIKLGVFSVKDQPKNAPSYAVTDIVSITNENSADDMIVMELDPVYIRL